MWEKFSFVVLQWVKRVYKWPLDSKTRIYSTNLISDNSISDVHSSQLLCHILKHSLNTNHCQHDCNRSHLAPSTFCRTVRYVTRPCNAQHTLLRRHARTTRRPRLSGLPIVIVSHEYHVMFPTISSLS